MFLGEFCAFQLDAIHVSHSAQMPRSEICFFLPSASPVVPQLLRADIGVGKFSAWRREGSETFGDLITAFQDLKGAYRKTGEGPFIRAGRNRMRRNGFKMEESRFRIDMRKKYFYCERGETQEQVGQ